MHIQTIISIAPLQVQYYSKSAPDAPKVPTWRLERDLNPRPSGWKVSTQPMLHHVPQLNTTVGHKQFSSVLLVKAVQNFCKQAYCKLLFTLRHIELQFNYYNVWNSYLYSVMWDAVRYAVRCLLPMFDVLDCQYSMLSSAANRQFYSA